MMLCMCWDEQSEMDENGEHLGQCGTGGAARMAQEAGVKKLVLVHIGPNLSKSEVQSRGKDEITSIYSGEILFADELTKIDL